LICAGLYLRNHLWIYPASWLAAFFFGFLLSKTRLHAVL
jgi:hypothetical protein